MAVNRIVPNILSADIGRSRDFYVDFLGLEIVLAMDWIVTFASPDHPELQVSLITRDETAPVVADMSVEVERVDEVYHQALSRGIEIVYPLTDELWGVRRFFVRDPNGKIVNIVSHHS